MNDFSAQIKTMVGSLAHGAAALGDMSTTFSHSNTSVLESGEQISRTIESIASGATDQAMHTQNINDNIRSIETALRENETMLHDLKEVSSMVNEEKEHGLRALPKCWDYRREPPYPYRIPRYREPCECRKNWRSEHDD